MIARDTALQGAEALWSAMVELAEAGNDLTVASQAEGIAQDAMQIANYASDLSVLARAAAILAMHGRQLP
ncbi:MAG: hypothetical protein JSS00_03280 [Proteobacteria bacterium]|nr:hypothetical protein [Pseudomonadota bacterium]